MFTTEKVKFNGKKITFKGLSSLDYITFLEKTGAGSIRELFDAHIWAINKSTGISEDELRNNYSYQDITGMMNKIFTVSDIGYSDIENITSNDGEYSQQAD